MTKKENVSNVNNILCIYSTRTYYYIGQFKSCAADRRSGYDFYDNNNSGFDRLTTTIDALYSKFYKNNLTDVETSEDNT